MSRIRKQVWIRRSNLAAIGCWFMLTLPVLCGTSRARAQSDAACTLAKARAASDAALLMAPRLVLQQLRYPNNTQIDLGGTTERGFQFRTGLSFLPLDFFKGRALLDAGDAACEEHRARHSLQEQLAHAREIVRLDALRAQADYLNEHHAEWQAIVSRAADRLSNRVITLIEFTRLRQLTDGLERKLVQVESGYADLRRRLPADANRDLDDLIALYTATSARFERTTASARALDAWRLRLMGGVIATSPVAWYGAAELEFSFGGLVRPAHEHAYEQARAEEIRSASYELPAQVLELRAHFRLSLQQARRELEISERTLSTITSARQVLEKLASEDVEHARDTLSVEAMSAEAEAVYLAQLITDLEPASELHP